MDKTGEMITQDNYPDIYDWLIKSVLDYTNLDNNRYTLLNGKINAYCSVIMLYDIKEIKYPFGYVKGSFNCNNCFNLKSLNGSPYKVGNGFNCSVCNNLTSLIGSPVDVVGNFECNGCQNLTSFKGFPKTISKNIGIFNNRFYNNPSYKEEYKLYLAMWLELLESVSNDERLEYIKNYKDKISRGEPIIPIEILKEYGF